MPGTCGTARRCSPSTATSPARSCSSCSSGRCARRRPGACGGCRPSARASAAMARCWRLPLEGRGVIARRVETEWLDVLPPGDPRAQRSRRELTRVNALMANAGIVAAELRAMGKVPREIADLGAGDGRFAVRLARALGTPPAGARLTLVDRQDVVDHASRNGLEALGWRVESVQADVAEWLASPAAARESMVANLFLHHFDDAPLARLLALIAQRTRRFVACEPRRSALAATGAR